MKKKHKRKKRAVFVLVSNDKYEHILALGDTTQELAEQLGISDTTIRSAMSHAKARGTNCRYKKVVFYEGRN